MGPGCERGEAQEPALKHIGKAGLGRRHLGKQQGLPVGFPGDARCLAVLSEGGQTEASALRTQASRLGFRVWWPRAGSTAENRRRGVGCGWDAWVWRRRGALGEAGPRVPREGQAEDAGHPRAPVDTPALLGICPATSQEGAGARGGPGCPPPEHRSLVGLL